MVSESVDIALASAALSEPHPVNKQPSIKIAIAANSFLLSFIVTITHY
jgi:hypothetical protein